MTSSYLHNTSCLEHTTIATVLIWISKEMYTKLRETASIESKVTKPLRPRQERKLFFLPSKYYHVNFWMWVNINSITDNITSALKEIKGGDVHWNFICNYKLCSLTKIYNNSLMKATYYHWSSFMVCKYVPPFHFNSCSFHSHRKELTCILLWHHVLTHNSKITSKSKHKRYWWQNKQKACFQQSL